MAADMAAAVAAIMKAAVPAVSVPEAADRVDIKAGHADAARLFQWGPRLLVAAFHHVAPEQHVKRAGATVPGLA